MTSIKSFLTRYAVPAYFAATFAISWAGVLFVIGGPSGFTGTTAQKDPLFPFVYLAMLVGPSVAGVALTALVGGRAGLHAFRVRLTKWRVGVWWYAAALLIAPIVTAVVLMALSFFSSDFVPALFTAADKGSLLVFALAIGLGAGIFEELGWTGFAVPGLRLRHGALATSLIVGSMWAAWHALVVTWGIGGASGGVPLALFVPLDLFSFLPGYRALMVWVYDRTRSLFVAMLMHASLTTTSLLLNPPATGVPLLIYLLVLAAALWMGVAATMLVSHRRLPQVRYA